MNRNMEQELDRLQSLRLPHSALDIGAVYKRIREKAAEKAPMSMILGFVLLLSSVIASNLYVSKVRSTDVAVQLPLSELMPNNDIYGGGSL